MKLEGLKVIDLSLFLPGPAVTLMMADHGAEVIKIENPNIPEPTRSSQFFPWVQGESTVVFRTTQRGKKSLTLNLKEEEGKKILYKLVEEADVFVESFRPGVMSRLGIDYDTLSKINKKLVYCSMSAFGQDGPWRDKPAHDTAAVAAAGILSLTKSPEENGSPAIIGVAISDMLSSHLAFGGIMMALYRAKTSGVGDYVDISMFESVLNASPNIVGPVFGGNAVPKRLSERTHGGNAMLNIYKVKGDNFIALGGGEHKFVKELFEGLGRPEFIDAVTGPAGEGHWPAIKFLRDEFLKKDKLDWEKWFNGKDICWMHVCDLKEAWDSPQVWKRQMRVKDPDGNDHIGIPIKFMNEPGRINFALPKHGEHSKEILKSLKYQENDIEDLKSKGVI